jgi:hypothetical protein
MRVLGSKDVEKMKSFFGDSPTPIVIKTFLVILFYFLQFFYSLTPFQTILLIQTERKFSNEIQTYMKERYESQVSWYDDKAQKNKKMFINYQNTIIILGATILVLSAFLTSGVFDFLSKDYYINWDKIATIIASDISAAIAVVTAKEKLNQPMSNWYSYRTRSNVSCVLGSN